MPVKKTFSIEERVKIALEDGDFNGASNAIERFLDENPTCSRAYFYKLLIEFRFKSADDLISHGTPLDNNANYKRALEYGSAKEKKELEGINAAILERIDTAKKKLIYKDAMGDWSAHRYARAIERFESIKDFEDVASKIEECKVAWEERKRAVRYKNAITLAGEARSSKRGIAKLEKAIEILSVDPTYENSANMITNFKDRIETIKIGIKRRNITIVSVISGILLLIVTIFTITSCNRNNDYEKALSYFEKGEYSKSIKLFDELGGYKYSETYLEVSESVKYIEKNLPTAAKNELIRKGYTIHVKYDKNGGISNITDRTLTKISDSLIPSGPINKFGYEFAGWSFYDLDFNPKTEKVTFKYRAEYELATYDIVYVDPTNSAVDVGTKVTSYTINDTFDLHSISANGYVFNGWYYMDGNEKVYISSINAGEYGKDLVLTADMVGLERNVTISPSVNGTISLVNTIVKSGDTVNISVNPDEGYKLKQTYFIIKGTTEHHNFNGLFKMPGEDITIYAEFEHIKYTVNVVIHDSHSFDVKPEYVIGEQVVVNVDVKEGYTLNEIYYVLEGSDTQHPLNNGDTLTIGSKNITLYINITPNINTISNGGVSNGAITVLGSAATDSEVNVSCTTDTGYYVEKMYYVVEGTSEEINIVDNKFIMPSKNVTIYAITQEYFQVTLVVDGYNRNFDVKQNIKIKDAFGISYDLNNTMGYYSDDLCRVWVDPETIVSDGLVLHTRKATLSRLRFSEDNTTVYYTTFGYYYDLAVPAYHNNVKITKFGGYGEKKFSHSFENVYLPYGLEIIGTAAFFNMHLNNDAGELYIPATVKTIESVAFYDYGSALTETIIFAGDVETIGSKAFYDSYCAIKLNYSKIKRIEEYAFYNSSTSIDIVLDSIEYIGYKAFSGSDFTSVTINNNPELNSSSQFNDMNNMTSFSAPNLTTTTDYMFWDCLSLENVNLPMITSIEFKMFSGCSSLESFEIGGYVTKIDSYAFEETKLKSIDIPTNVTYVSLVAFRLCESLDYIILHSGVKYISGQNADYIAQVSSVVYFEGTDEVLEDIYIYDDGTKEVIKIYSDTPIYDGKHWHYVDEIPTIYTQE